MLSSFVQFAINSILFMFCLHYGTKIYYYFKNGRHQLAKARAKKRIKELVDKI